MSSFIRPFLPWIAYAVVSSATDWRRGALSGFVLVAWGLIATRRAGRPWNSAVIEVCSALYFAGVMAIAFAQPDSPLKPYTQSASSAWLALTAWASLAIRQPFTLGIARQSVPREVWEQPLFYRVNAIITAVWAASFTLSAAALAALHFAGDPAAAIAAVAIAGFVVPAVFTNRYSAAVRARHAV